MGLLIDTQTIVWLATTPRRVGRSAFAPIIDPNEALFVSVATAFECADLNIRGRFRADLPLDPIIALLGADVLPLPAETWRLIDALPQLDRDPVDRMLVAHAIYADLTLITADEIVRSYPVRSLW